MPKSILRDPELVRGETLFGSKLQPVSLSALSAKTGIPISTLSAYKAHPDNIPLGRLARIVKARALNEEEVKKLLRG